MDKPIDYTIITFQYEAKDGLSFGSTDDVEIQHKIAQRKLHEGLRKKYLDLTLKNARLFTSKKILIGVCSKQNYDMINEWYPQDKLIKCVFINDLTNTFMLPLSFCHILQKQCCFNDSDIIYYTEDDQELYSNNLGEHISFLKDDPHCIYYISPHRLNRTHKKEDAQFILSDGYSYSTESSRWNAKLFSKHESKYYSPINYIEAFSSSMILKYGTFKKVNFHVVKDIWPIESVIHSVFLAFKCIQTSNVKALFVIHLGGYLNHFRSNEINLTVFADDFSNLLTDSY